MSAVHTQTATVARRASGRRIRSTWVGQLAMVPSALLLGALILVPLVMLVVYAFTTDGGSLSLSYLSQIVGDSTYVDLLTRTVWLAVRVALISIVVGWPAAWALAKHVSPRVRNVLLALTVIPFLTSYLLLIYGMLVVLAPGGPTMSLLHSLGLTSSDASILYTPRATGLMLVYESLPIVVLVLFAASDRIDDSLLDAARSLGAGRIQVFRQVILPLTTPSLITCFVLTFVPSAGAFAESQVLGGPDGLLLGNAISDNVSLIGDQRFAAALSLLLLGAVFAVVVVVQIMPRVVAAASRRA